MDVKGDGNCGYYALLLALLNTGIDEYDIDTTNDNARRRAQRWERQVVELRDHLRQGSESILREVYRPGSPSRSLPWWGNIIGTLFEEDQERLSEGFVNPEFEGNPSLYFSPDFAQEEELREYHMDPYWAAFVIAYVFKVRVVLITRATSPSPAAPKGVAYHYATNIYNFDANFQDSIDTYTPVVQTDNDAVRISDTQFHLKKTIELLYTTGYTKTDGTADNNHFQFLRRVYCNKVSPHLPIMNSTCLGQYLQSQETAAHPPARGGNNVATTAGTVAPIVLLAPTEENVAATTRTTAPMVTEPGSTLIYPLQPLTERNPGKKILPPKPSTKAASQTKKKAEKTVTKAKQPSKVPRKTTGARIGGTAVNLNHSEDEENEPRDANDGEFDYMYDRRTGFFYRGTFNSKLRRYLNKTIVPDISVVDKETIEAAREEPNTWISPALGDPWDEPPPRALTTNKKTLYQQVNRPFCLTYCLASALYYCRFEQEASMLAGQAIDVANYNMRSQLRRIIAFMPNLVPLIGGVTVYNQRSNSNGRKKRSLTWKTLFDTPSRFPTLLIPVKGRTGRMNHAVCVVDDLIFDASTPFALKLCMDSMEWIFQDYSFFL